MTNGLCGRKDLEVENGLQQLQNVPEESDGDAGKAADKHEVLSIQEEANENLTESYQSQLSHCGTQPAISDTYSSKGHSQNFFSRETLHRWWVQDNKETLSVTHVSKLLYPYRRRHPFWKINIYALLAFWQSSHPAENGIPRLQISRATDEWFRDMYGDDQVNEVSVECEQLSSQKRSNRKIYPSFSNISRAAIIWSQLPDRQKRMRWPCVMLKCLTVSTEHALDFLLATDIEPFPSFEMVMDTLLYLKTVRDDEIKCSPELNVRYQRVLSQQRQPSRWINHMEEKHLGLLLEYCSSDEGRNLFEKLLDAEIDLNYHCMLKFMDFFTRIGDIELALKALNGIDLRLRLRSDQDLLPRCMNLLKLETITCDGASPNFQILPRILEAGVKPDIALYNLIIKNAVSLGASVVGWDLFRYIQDRGLPTDARTYLPLMQDALACQDTAALQELLSEVHAREDLSNNLHLVVYTLDIVRVHGFESRLSPCAVFSNMLAVYTRTFSLAPLKHLKMVAGEATSFLSGNQIEPNAETLSYVVHSYVLAQQSAVVVQSLLDWTEHLWSQGDGLVLALAQCLPFYDGFLAFFARRRETLPKCLRLIQLMLDRKVQPSATSWGILVLAFTKHGQIEAAQKVRNMMYQLGLRMNEKTTRMVRQLEPHAEPAGVSSMIPLNLGRPSEGISSCGQSASAGDCGRTEDEPDQLFLDNPFMTASNITHWQGVNLPLPKVGLQIASADESNAAYDGSSSQRLAAHTQTDRLQKAVDDTSSGTPEQSDPFFGGLISGTDD